jgi:hypothetical protein
MGGKEDIAYNNCQIMLFKFDELNIKYIYYEFLEGILGLFGDIIYLI